MPTTKKRINITLSEEMDKILIKLAKRDAVPTATKAIQLIKLGLEMEEDIYLNKVAEDAEKRTKKFYSHEEAWK